MSDDAARLILIRHGETEWSQAGRHTGRTDIPLTPKGRSLATLLKTRLAEFSFAAVWTSPLSRARDTATLAGFPAALPRPELLEWDYGADEGRTHDEIRKDRPGWDPFRDGFTKGEPIASVGARCDAVIHDALELHGDIALFAHGHVLRILAARYLELPPEEARRFSLGTASVSVLGREWTGRALTLWNDQHHLHAAGLTP